MNIIDKIIDYAGNEHPFVISAVKVIWKDTDDSCPFLLEDAEEKYMRVGLKIGIAICNPIDKFDEKIGINKAIARANNSKCSLYAEYPGQITDDLINAYLKQEAEYIKVNPEKFIKGYKEGKKRYEKHKEMEELKKNFTNIEHVILEELKENPTYLDNIKKYLDYFFKCAKR